MRLIPSIILVLAFASLIHAADKPTTQPESRPALPHFSAGGMSIGDSLTEGFRYKYTPAKDKDKIDITGFQTIELDHSKVGILYQFYDSKLIGVSLSFESKLFPSLVTFYTDKFGSVPSDQRVEKVQTKMGVEFRNEIVSWKTDAGTFTISKYGSDIENGFATIETSEIKKYEELVKREEMEKLKRKL